jgi:hypothetical protein
MMAYPTILLTATIEPGKIPYLKRADPELRRRDYTEAFLQWMAYPIENPIVFCENSGADVSDFETLARNRRSAGPVEIISFRAQEGVEFRGKGYGELRLVEHALASSALLAAAPLVMKVTGRLFISNAAGILGRISDQSATVFCDLRQNLSIADSRVFLASPDFLSEYLVPRALEIDDLANVMFETVLARAVHGALSEGATWRPLPLTPRWHGLAGTADLPYKSSVIDLWRREVFRMLKAVILKR